MPLLFGFYFLLLQVEIQQFVVRVVAFELAFCLWTNKIDRSCDSTLACDMLVLALPLDRGANVWQP